MEIGQHPIVGFNGADIHNCSDRNGMDVRACLVYDVGLRRVPYRIIRSGQRKQKVDQLRAREMIERLDLRS
jgi:hypothetical protein